ncbi:MAG: hypothetical protein JNM17_35760 [Archangium sp.]|nr:hypothetical protein [Archangium sp.]
MKRWSTAIRSAGEPAAAMVLFAGLALTISFTLIPPEKALNVAYVPARDDVVLEKVPVRARAAPGVELSEQAAAQRARELITQARARGGDPRLLGQAQAVLSKWWSSQDASSELLLMRATVKQSLHDFDGALADLDLVVGRDPHRPAGEPADSVDPQAWLTRATVLTVQGRYADAVASCQHLNASERVLETMVCVAIPEALQGKLSESRAKLSELVVNEPASKAWVSSVRGELERWAGDDVAAEKSLREAVMLDAGDSYSRSLLAELLLDLGRPKEVVALYAGRELNDTELLWVVLANPEDAARKEELAARVAANRQRGETLHRREESRYALRVEGDAEMALTLAVENWKVQREPADARVFIEAAVAAHRSVALEPVRAWLNETKLPWPVLHKLLEQTP